MDNAIQWINVYPVDSAVRFVNTYPLDSDLFVGWRYAPFEQLGPARKPFPKNLNYIHKVPFCRVR